MELPVKPYIKNEKKTSYAVEGAESYLIDCGDGVNVFTRSEKAVAALKNMDFAVAQAYQHETHFKSAIINYWKDIVDIPLQRIFPSEGAQTFLYDTCRLFLEPGDKVIGLGPCYAEFSSDIRMWGAYYDYVPLRPENNYRFDLEEFLDRMDGSHKLAYIDTPNNPTGQVIPLAEIEEVVRKAASLELPIVIDESYGGYMPRDNSAISLIHKYDNLIMLFSFSKAHGIAGARAGYGILPEQLAVPMDNITHPYICCGPSRVLAEALMEDEGFLERTVEITAEYKRPFLERTWEHLRVAHTDPATVIFLVTHDDPSVDLKKAFDRQRIKVSKGTVFAGLGSNACRLRVPWPEETEAVLAAMDAIDREEQP